MSPSKPLPIRRDAIAAGLAAVAATALLQVAGCGRPPDTSGAAPTLPAQGPVPVRLLPEAVVAASPELLAEGKALYAQQCAPCHGAGGRGDGEAAYLLYPKPRDFVAANYRMVSTWEGKPTETDIYYTISRGMPGSAMPSWAQLDDRKRWALVHHVKSLARTPFTTPPATDPAGPGDQGTGILRIGTEPADDAASRTHGRELYLKACGSCHGPEGHGDGVQEQRDDKGFPTRPRDLTLGVFKGDPSPAGVYRRIVLGLTGSPMPASPWAYPDDAWHLTHYIRSLSTEPLRERVEMKKYSLVAQRVKALPQHPDAGDWRAIEPVRLHLMPLWWRTERPEEITVRAVHDGRDLVLLLEWPDETDDHTAIRPQDFRDAAAVELSPTDDPPFFAMGEKGRLVNIWMWKSEKQADIDAVASFQDLEAVYPRLAIDSYPNLALAGVEQPGRHALTLQSDPTFVSGWGAGNIVSDPRRAGSAEDLKAQGFGTLKAHPRTDQKVYAKGVWRLGTYRVLLRRSLAPTGAGTVDLKPGGRLPVAFAVWNGSAGDRDGKKSVTIWQDLWLEP